MSAWEGSPVSESVEIKSDESDFEEDEALGGEQDELDEEEFDDEVDRPSPPQHADWDG
jgi:hypothetical protein